MTKTVLNRELRKLRTTLLSNCKEVQVLLGSVESASSISGKTKMFITEVSGTRSELTSAAAAVGLVDLSKILVYVQGSMVNEWISFLDSVFGAVVLYLVKSKSSTLPSVDIDLSNVSTTGARELRESLADAAREAFSLNIRYKGKITLLEKLFTVTRDDRLFEEMHKHVVIRHVWQHNEGKIRARDLAKIGRDGQFVSILKDGGGTKQIRVGQKVFLTKAEFERLLDVINRYSEKFEVLS